MRFDRWVRTGDEVKIDENGDVFVVDRLKVFISLLMFATLLSSCQKEIMKVKGFQVAPAELEGHLLDHPDVSDVCVVGVPDDYSGEVPLAFITLHAKAQERVKKEPNAEESLKESIIKVRQISLHKEEMLFLLLFRQHVQDAKVSYKWLTGGVEFIDVIPKNPSGKLLRRILRDRAKALRGKGPGVQVRSKL